MRNTQTVVFEKVVSKQMNSLGKLGERYAANYLIKHKYKLVESNFQSRFGEIDIIVKNKSYLVFVEVKQRDVNSIATPAEFVDKTKQNKIIATAKLYLENNPTDLQPRFDVIEIYSSNNKIKSLKHLENAFTLV